MSGTNGGYLPHKGDVVTIDFDPSSGSEIRKRRPALVISNSRYAAMTGLAVVCPITHAQNNRLRQTGLLVAIENQQVDGVVNPLQFHTFDYCARQMKYVTQLDQDSLRQVIQVVRDIIDARDA